MKTVSIIGVGRLGGALAIALSRVGFEIEQLIYRSTPPSAETISAVRGTPALVLFSEPQAVNSDCVFIAAGDDQIEAACAVFAPFVRKNAVMLHVSGSLSSEVLFVAAERGIATGSMHPLISTSDPVRGADVLAQAFFCIEGSDTAVLEAEGIVEKLGGRSFTVETAYKPLYHAAAVLSSGHVVSLFQAAVETLTRCGLDPNSAKGVLLPLLASSVRNLYDQEIAEALTGPFSRTDDATIRRHLNMFDRSGLDDIKRIYLEIGTMSLELAERQGASRDEVEKIRQTLKLALVKGR